MAEASHIAANPSEIKQVKPPENCPNCRQAHALKALAHYGRQQNRRFQKPIHPWASPRLKLVADLVLEMARGNRCWGCERIVGALENLGCKISPQRPPARAVGTLPQELFEKLVTRLVTRFLNLGLCEITWDDVPK